ncbi:MAG: glycoside hydrolase family 16 protein [Streptosporangiales bacterium]|nr:glycoside hydrolase family 16 protein [Streptosporangiales bacterium]
MDPRRYPPPGRRDPRPPGSGYGPPGGGHAPQRPSFEPTFEPTFEPSPQRPSPPGPGSGGYGQGGYDSAGYRSGGGYGPGGGYLPPPEYGPPAGYGPRPGYDRGQPGYDRGYPETDLRPAGQAAGRNPRGPGGRPPGRPPGQPGGRPPARPPRRPAGQPSGRRPGQAPGQAPGKGRRNPRIAAWVAGLSAVALVAAGGLFYARGILNGHSLSGYKAHSGSGAPAAAGGPGPSGSAGPSAPGSAAAAGVPASLGSGWKQTFNATFPGDRLNPSVWDTCYPWESQSGCANFGNSDEEFQWYTPSQDRVANGAMDIVAQKAPTEGTTSSGSPESYGYRSGLVTTFPGYSFQYGYIQAVAKMPSAKGLWTALWLAAKNESWPPEIDIVEHWDDDAKFFQYYHPAGAPRENSSVNLGSATGWHRFGLDWTASKVTWYVDGKPVFSTGRNVPQQPMYFLANIAVDEHVASLGSDAQLNVKSVSVWQHP